MSKRHTTDGLSEILKPIDGDEYRKEEELNTIWRILLLKEEMRDWKSHNCPETIEYRVRVGLESIDWNNPPGRCFTPIH